MSLTRRGPSVCDRRFALGCPAYRFDPAYDKNPADDTGDAQSRSDCEGPEEISGLLDDEPGEVLPVGRGPELPGLLAALDKMAVRPN